MKNLFNLIDDSNVIVLLYNSVSEYNKNIFISTIENISNFYIFDSFDFIEKKNFIQKRYTKIPNLIKNEINRLTIDNKQIIITAMTYLSPNNNYLNIKGGSSIIYHANLVLSIEEDYLVIKKSRYGFIDENSKFSLKSLKRDKILNSLPL